MSLSLVVGRLGDLDGALALLDQAEPALRGAERARATQNRGMIHYWRGEFGVAAATLDQACRALRRHGDGVAEARTRVTLGAVLGQVHDYRSAERHLVEAIDVATRLGQMLLVAVSHHNLGYLAMLQRDVPRALTEFELAEKTLSEIGADAYLPRVHADHAQVLADAALFDDADALLRRALDMLSDDGNAIEMAGALVTAAEIRLAQRDPTGARVAADEAASWYRKQGRDGWVAVARSLALQAAAREEQLSTDLADQLEDVAVTLDEGGLASRSSPLATRRLARTRRARRCRSRTIRCPPIRGDVSLAVPPATASCSPTSMPSPLNGAVIGRPRGGRSAEDSTWRCRARRPRARSRCGRTRPYTGTR